MLGDMGECAEKFERCSGRGLPADYRTFIDGYAGGPRLKHGGLEFRLCTADELLAPYTLDGTGLTRPFFSAHILHLAQQRDAGVLIFDGGPDPVSPERFDSMNTIGVGAPAVAWEQNLPPTHLLVLDPADGSLRSVPVEPPAVVRPVTDSFGKWIKAATRKPRKTAAKGAAAKGKPVRKRATKPPTPATVLAAFKRKNYLTLPPAYAKFLKAHDGNQTFPGPGDELWQLATLAELADPVLGTDATPDGERISATRLTRVFADAVQAEQGVRSLPVYGTKSKFTLARLRRGVCIGQCNGDVLFLDPTTKFSVWGYCREGNYVAKLADSFATFLKPPKPKVKKTAARKPSAKGRKPAVKVGKSAVKTRKPRAKSAAAAPTTPASPATKSRKPAVKRAPTVKRAAKGKAEAAPAASLASPLSPASPPSPVSPESPASPAAPARPRTARKRAA